MIDISLEICSENTDSEENRSNQQSHNFSNDMTNINCAANRQPFRKAGVYNVHLYRGRVRKVQDSLRSGSVRT